MAFPRDPIQIRVELALGADPNGEPFDWSWTDVSQWVRQTNPITIGRGRPDEFGPAAPAWCSLTVDNTDGRWVARNARGAWYGQIRKGTPLRVSVNPGSGWRVRFTGFIDALPPRQDLSGRNRYVPLTASGLLKRLSRPKAPLRSPAYRFGSTLDIARAYVPLEDGEGAQRAASGLPGKPNAERFGTITLPRWGTLAGPAGSAPLPDFADRRALTGFISGWGADDGGWSVSCWISGATTSGGSTCSPVQWRTDGTAGYWALLARWPGDGAGLQTPAGQLRIWVLAMSDPGENWALEDITNEALIGSSDNDWHHVRVVGRQVGGSIEVDLYVDDVGISTTSEAGWTIGRPGGYHINPTTQGAAYLDVPGVGISGIGHLLITTVGASASMYEAGLGWSGEPAQIRIASICDEEDVPILTLEGGAQPMGPQPIDTLLGIVRDAEATDGGLLYEARSGELKYLSGEERYNRVVGLSLNFAASQVAPPFEPTDDDQALRNVVTASRRSGTSYTYTDAEHVELYGRAEDGVQVNPASDARLPDHAAWRARQGTVDDLRVPGLSLNLAHPSQASLIPDWLMVDIGSRVQVTNLPTGLMQESLDVLIEGYTETIQRPRVWSATMNCSPASPWTVGVVEDDVLGRADTAGCRWVNAVNAGTDTAALAVTTQGPVWINSTSYAAQFPFEVRTGGVTLSVTGIAGAVADNFNRSVGAGGVGTATTGQPWSVGAGTASEFSVNGSVGRMALVSVNDLHVITLNTGSPDHDPIARLTLPVVPAGASITLRQYARWADASNHYFAELSVQTDAVAMLRLYRRVATVATVIGGPVQLAPLHTAGGAWWIQCSAMGSTIRARAWLGGQPESRGWHITATDTALTSGTRAGPGARREASNSNGSQTIDVENFAVPALQTFTFDQAPTNGVERTVPAGTALSLATPWRAAL